MAEPACAEKREATMKTIYPSVGIIVVFICMMLISNRDAERFKMERDQARHELTVIVPSLQRRINDLRSDMQRRELELIREHNRMRRQPPIWRTIAE